MKSTRLLLLFASGIGFLYGCSSYLEDTPTDNEEMIEVSFTLSGEISVSVNETPMDNTRAGESTSDDLYGIQVLQDGEKYAFGLFDNVAKMKLFLHSGHSYKAICSSIKNGKTVLKYYNTTYGTGFGKIWYMYDSESGVPHSCSQNGSNLNCYVTVADAVDPASMQSERISYYGFGFPFVHSSGSMYVTTAGVGGYSGVPTTVDNQFTYSSEFGMDYLSEGMTITAADLWEKYPSLERFYGESASFQAIKGNTTVSIPLKSTSFSFQCSISGITDGKVSLTINNDTKTLIEENGITSSFVSDINTYCFNNVEDAWKYNDYMENFTISMIWTRGFGGVVQDLGSQMIQLKRGKKNTVEIALDTN